MIAVRVNGELFINLTEEDWEDLGITNRFHIRKLKLILKAFQVRYQRKKDKIVVDEEDDLLSEYSPSELSDLLAAEDAQAQDEESVDDSIDVCIVFCDFYVWCLLCFCL